MRVDVLLPSGLYENFEIHDNFYRALMGTLRGLEEESKHQHEHCPCDDGRPEDCVYKVKTKEE